MPYIKNDLRNKYFDDVDKLGKKIAKDTEGHAGIMNYAITRMIQSYFKQLEDEGGRVGYSQYNEIIGMLECCKLELYRREVSVYEDEKIKENGDVY